MAAGSTSFLLEKLFHPFIAMPGVPYLGARPELSIEQQLLKRRLESHVRILAHEIGERHIHRYSSLQAAWRYIEDMFRQHGYEPNMLLHLVNKKVMFNVEAVKTGTIRPNRKIIIGSHYDTVPGSPGANDNASAVAAMLELSFWAMTANLPATICFVGFCNEEHVHLPTTTMGSFAYAKQCWQRGDNIFGMLALETIGSYYQEEGSQKYPWPFKQLYPSTADFVGFIGNWKSRHLIRQCVGSFRQHNKFPCYGLAAPGIIRDAGRSDHFFFPRFGYDALMVTDTANFRYRFYHTKDDTIDKLNFDGLTLVVDGLKAVITDLAFK